MMLNAVGTSCISLCKQSVNFVRTSCIMAHSWYHLSMYIMRDMHNYKIDSIFLWQSIVLFRLDGSGSIKVGDFGLAEDVYARGYFRQDKFDVIKVPYRWMAPESLRDGLFSEKSDVVSQFPSTPREVAW